MAAKIELTNAMLEDIQKYAAQGLTEEQIAHNIGVGYTWFQEKKKVTREMRERLKVGKASGIQAVVSKLFQKAQGFYIEEEKAFYNSKQGEVVKVKVRKYIPPDLGCMAFYLKNKDPVNWKDVRHVEQKNKSVVDDEVKQGMTAQEAAESYYETLREGPGNTVVPLKRKR
jgi:hypothetical protein